MQVKQRVYIDIDPKTGELSLMGPNNVSSLSFLVELEDVRLGFRFFMHTQGLLCYPYIYLQICTLYSFINGYLSM